MSGRAVVVVAAALVIVCAAAVAAQPEPPELTNPVNDFAGVLDPASRQQIDTISRRLEEASGDAIVVATIKTFEPWGDIRTYAAKMFENGGRGIGRKGRDNGLLVLLAVDDRRVWVEVGYDLEGFITDGFAGETSRDVMTPYFRQEQYGAGLVAGVSTIAQRIAQARNVSLDGLPQPARRARRESGVPLIVWIILAVVIINFVMGAMGGRGSRRRRGRWDSHVGPFGGGYGGWSGGGGWGGGGGGFGGGFGGFGGGRSGGGGGGASW